MLTGSLGKERLPLWVTTGNTPAQHDTSVAPPATEVTAELPALATVPPPLARAEAVAFRTGVERARYFAFS